jgi:RAB protein geranylgeranyltransferase component A
VTNPGPPLAELEKESITAKKKKKKKKKIKQTIRSCDGCAKMTCLWYLRSIQETPTECDYNKLGLFFTTMGSLQST